MKNKGKMQVARSHKAAVLCRLDILNLKIKIKTAGLVPAGV
jgi:hypothetical protein